MNPLEREKKDIIKYLDSPVFFLGWLSPPPAVLLFRLTFQLDDEARSFSDVAATLVCCHNKRDMDGSLSVSTGYLQNILIYMFNSNCSRHYRPVRIRLTS